MPQNRTAPRAADLPVKSYVGCLDPEFVKAGPDRWVDADDLEVRDLWIDHYIVNHGATVLRVGDGR